MKKILFLLLISLQSFGAFNTTTTVRFDPSNLSAFGDLTSVGLTPILQGDFVYNTRTFGMGTSTGTGATVDTSLGRLRVQSGTTATTGTAIFVSNYPAKYRAGEGVLARFTTVFDTGQAGNVQEIGMMTATDGYAFGFNGTSFGILHRNSGTGSLVETWIPQTSWNGDKANGTGASGMNWRTQNGNVCMIVYPFLGYGDVRFYVEDSASSRFILVHTICYANTSQYIQLSNPTLNFWVRSANTGANTTNTILHVGSVGVFVTGQVTYTGGDWAKDTLRTGVTTENAILSLRNATTYNGVANKGVVKIKSISFLGNTSGANPSGVVVMRLKIQATLAGDSVYQAVNGTTSNNGISITEGKSVVSTNTTHTTVTGGDLVYSSTANMNNGYSIDLENYHILLLPSQTLSITISSTSSATVACSVNWVEDL